MLVVLGALLVIAGLLQMAYQAIWKGRLSDARPHHSTTEDTLEPRGQRGAFGLKANWPGFALVVVGGILLLVGDMF